MASRVVSTKVNEVEHSKLLQLCNQKGLTVSTLLKQAILERIDEESRPEKELPKKIPPPTPPNVEKTLVREDEPDSDRYLYF